MKKRYCTRLFTYSCFGKCELPIDQSPDEITGTKRMRGYSGGRSTGPTYLGIIDARSLAGIRRGADSRTAGKGVVSTLKGKIKMHTYILGHRTGKYIG